MTIHTCKNGATLQYCKEKLLVLNPMKYKRKKQKVASDLPPPHHLSCEMLIMHPDAPKLRALGKHNRDAIESELSKELRGQRSTEGGGWQGLLETTGSKPQLRSVQSGCPGAHPVRY